MQNKLIMPPDLQNFVAVIGLFLFIGLVFFVAWVATIVDIVKNEFTEKNNKIIWLILVLCLAPLGVVLYFFIGRYQKVGNEKVSSNTRYRDIGRD